MKSHAFILLLILPALASGLSGGCRAIHGTTGATSASKVEKASTPVYFRSDGGCGAADAAIDPAMSLEAATVWSVPLAKKPTGFSSPVVADGKIFLTAADADRCFVMAYSLADGSLLWQSGFIPPPGGRENYRPGEYGLACSTACWSDGRVVAFFADGWAYCLDGGGELLWSKQVTTEPINAFGLAASPIIWGNTVIFQIDLDEDDQSEQLRSFLTALSLATGEPLWRVPREVWPSWSTPVIAKAGQLDADRDVLVTTASPWAIGYDPADGRELWRCGELIGDVAATPAVGDGRVYAFSDPSGDVMAIRPDGSGDISETAVVWRCETDPPDVAAGLYYDGRVYYCGSMMEVHCLTASDGGELWTAPLATTAYASPLIVGGKVCVVDTKGNLTFFDPVDGSAALQLKLPGEVTATPAAMLASSGGKDAARLVVRSSSRLMLLQLAR